ncbi:MAG: signal peptidase I [Thermoprotei archaeon]|nr:MAG: signal peptidase I [Thermoprotei archaeon]
MSISRIFCKVLQYALLLSLLSLTILSVISSHIGKPILTVVASYSMEPTLMVGDLLVINPVINSVNPEELVLYRRGTTLIVHRVLAVEGDVVITKGDANLVPDVPPPRMSNVVGKVVVAVPYIGAFSLLVQYRPWILILIIMLLVTYLVLIIVRSITSSRDIDIKRSNL